MRKDNSFPRVIDSGGLLLQHARETIYIRKIDGDPSRLTTSFVSDNVEQLLGYKARDFINKPELWISIIHVEDAKKVEKKIKDIISKRSSKKAKKPLRLIYRIRSKKTRKYRWVQDVITPQLDARGRTIGFVGSLMDITEQFRAEKSERKGHLSRRSRELSEQASPGKSPANAMSTSMFSKARVGVYQASPDGRILYANRALIKMLGLKNLEALKEKNLKERIFGPRIPREDFIRRVKIEGAVNGFESEWKKNDGSAIFVRENGRIVRDGDKNILYYEGTVEDLTEVKLAEERSSRLNQLQRTLLQIDKLIVRSSTPEVLFHDACAVLVREGKYRMSWIGVLDKSGKVVHPVAWSGIKKRFLEEIIKTSDGKSKGPGLIEEAVRTGSACVSGDLLKDTIHKAGRSEAEKRGYRSAGTFPIRVGGKVVGVVNVFAGSSDGFSSEEVRILSELADEIGVALWTFEVRAKEKSTNDAVRDREFWLSESQRVARIGSYVFDIASESFTSSLMLDEILGTDPGFKHDLDSIMNVIHPEDRERIIDQLKDALSEKKSINIEFRIVRPSDKVERWIWGKGELMLDSAGEPTSVFGMIQDITDRKHDEEAQERERILLRTLIDNLPSAIFVKDTQYRKTVVNSQHVKGMAAHLGGLGLNSEQEILGKTDFDLYPRDLAEKYFEEDQKIIRDGESILNEEVIVVNADGRKSWLLESKVPLRDKDGTIQGLVGIMTDITPQKEAEEATKKERILFRTVIDNIPHSIYVKDTNYRKIIANPENVSHTGMQTEAEVCGKTDFDLFPKEIAAKFFVDDQTVIREGKSVINREEYVIQPDGRLRWLLTTKVPLHDEHGAIRGLVGIGIDVTERKQAEEALEHERTLLRTLIENLPDAVFVKDNEYKRTIVNKAYLRGIVTELNRPDLGSESAILGKTDFEVYPRKLAEKHFLDDQKVIRDGERIIGREEATIDSDGNKRWISISKIPLRDKGGVITGLLGIISDFTDRKFAEEEHERERVMLRTLVDHLPSAIYVKDKQYRKILVNLAHLLAVENHLRRLGFDSSKDILGLTDFDVYPKELAEEYFMEDRKIIEEGYQVLDREEVGVDAMGNREWRLVSKLPLRDERGNIIGLVGITSDITGLKKNEEDVSRERILLRTLIDNLPFAVYVKDTNCRKVISNPADVLLCSCSREEEVIGKTDFDFFPRELAEEFFLRDQKVIANGEALVGSECLHLDSNGNEHWLLTSKVPLRSETGAITGLVGVGIDITEQKKLDMALRQSENELRSLFASMKDVVIVFDKNGKYLRIAPTNPELLYKPARELIGKTFHELFDSRQADEFLSVTHKALDTGELQNLEYKLEINGKETWFDGSFSRLEEDKVLLVARDVTAHRRAVEALRKSEETLKQIMESVDDAIYSIDGQTAEFTYVSPVFERKLGYSLSEIEKMGGRWAFLNQVIQHGNSAGLDPVVTDLQKHVVHEIPVWENWWRCKDGSLLYIEDQSVPTYDGDKLVRIDGVLRDITDWKLSEDSKQREQILLRTLIDNVPYGIYVKDKDCRKVLANPADVQNMGCHSEAEVLGKSDFDFYPKEIAENFFADDHTVIQQGKIILNREEYFFDPDGKKHWLWTTKVPLRDETGMIIGLVGIGANITERKSIEEALRRSEAELRALFESMKDVILVLGKDGRFLRVSPTDDSLLHRPAAELIGRTSYEVFPKEQAEYFLSVIRKTLESGKTQNAEYAIDIRGEEKWRNATVSPLTVDTVLWVARDITERKIMEKGLRDSEKKYRDLVENALLAVYRTTTSGRIIYANKAMADMLEYNSTEELVSIKAFDLYKDFQQREGFVQELRMHGKTIKTNEVEWVTKTGKIRNVLLSASLDGEIISGMAKDITEFRTLEKQFLQTQKLEGLGNIAAGIAHDFNNILGVILGYADLLSQSAFDPKKFQRGTQAILKSGERGKSLVKQLLTFARKTETMFGSVDVNEIVSEIEKLMRETFPKTIVISTKLRDDLPIISGDASQINQVLLNICVNARDAMPKGGEFTISTDVVAGEVLVSVFPDAVAKRYVEIRLEDTGTGMSEDTRHRIFEPFFTTKEVGKGTGLGLSVAYGIMQSHRGFIDVASQPQKGAIFSVYFPVFEYSREDFSAAVQSTQEISGGTDTVLIIEDEEMLRDLLRTILESKGYSVLAAGDGEEGVETFKKYNDRIAVVLSDLGLPKLSGEETISAIRRLNPEARVIIASGFIDPDIRSELEVFGVKDFILKPYVANEVLKVVRDVIDKGNA